MSNQDDFTTQSTEKPIVNAYYAEEPLHSAVGKNQIDEVKLLLDKGFDINFKDYYGKTPLHIASYFSDAKMIKVLLDNGAKLDSKDSEGLTPSSYAILSDKVQNLKILERHGANLDEKIRLLNGDGEDTVVSHSITILNEDGENIVYNIPLVYHIPQSKSGSDLLHFAAINGKLNSVKFLVLEKGFDINAKDSNGNSPIFHAVIADKLDTAKLLLELGADIDYLTKDGMSMLHFAALSCKLEILKFVMDRMDNVDLNAPGIYNIRPLDCALEIFSEGCNFEEEVLELLNFMFNNGAKVSNLTAGEYGRAEIHAAFNYFEGEKYSKAVIDLLIEKGADINVADQDGNNVMHYAVRSGMPELVKIAIEKGADINHCNVNGKTPLDEALEDFRSPEIVDVLIQKGADVNIDTNGLSDDAKQYLADKSAEMLKNGMDTLEIDSAAKDNADVPDYLPEEGAAKDGSNDVGANDEGLPSVMESIDNQNPTELDQKQDDNNFTDSDA